MTATHVPALAYDVLTPLYDTLVALTLREREVRDRLVRQAALVPGCRVLDVGCGTGTLALLLAAAEPSATVVGLDVDARILDLARGKAERAGARIEWVQGSATAPPLPPASFDRVVSSLVLHHLTTEEKRQALEAMFHRLRSGGTLHLVDFGPPHTTWTRLAAAAFRYFDGAERTGDNLDGRLPALVRDAGFVDVVETHRQATLFGTLVFLRAAHP